MTTTLPNPLDHVVFRGRIMDRKTAALLVIAERRLGYELSVTQGCYNAGVVAASGGTHDEGGVGDLAPYDHRHKVKVLRDLGCAAWYRPAIPRLWSAHIHFVVIGHQDLAPAAADQVVKYNNGENGLAGHTRDPNPYRPEVEPFSFSDAWHDDLLRQRITGFKARLKTLRDRASAIRRRMETSSEKITYKR